MSTSPKEATEKPKTQSHLPRLLPKSTATSRARAAIGLKNKDQISQQVFDANNKSPNVPTFNTLTVEKVSKPFENQSSCLNNESPSKQSLAARQKTFTADCQSTNSTVNDLQALNKEIDDEFSTDNFNPGNYIILPSNTTSVTTSSSTPLSNLSAPNEELIIANILPEAKFSKMTNIISKDSTLGHGDEKTTYLTKKSEFEEMKKDLVMKQSAIAEAFSGLQELHKHLLLTGAVGMTEPEPTLPWEKASKSLPQCVEDKGDSKPEPNKEADQAHITSQLRRASKRNRDHEKTINVLNSQIQAQVAAMANAEKQAKLAEVTYDQKLRVLREKVRMTENNYHNVNKDKDILNNKVEESTKKLEAEEVCVSQLKWKVEQLTGQLQLKSQQEHSMEMQKSQLKNNLDHLNEMKEKLSLVILEKDKIISKKNEEIAVMQENKMKREEELKLQYHHVQKQFEELKNQIKQLNQEHETELKNIEAKMMVEKQKLNSEIDSKDEKIHVMVKLLKSLEEKHNQNQRRSMQYKIKISKLEEELQERKSRYSLERHSWSSSFESIQTLETNPRSSVLARQMSRSSNNVNNKEKEQTSGKMFTLLRPYNKVFLPTRYCPAGSNTSYAETFNVLMSDSLAAVSSKTGRKERSRRS